jgi:hypothetical protein
VVDDDRHLALGIAVPGALTEANTVDVRDDASPWAAAIGEMFPEASPGRRGVPKLPAPKRPPDPPHWPKYRPY